MKYVPKKNISPIISDVKWPEGVEAPKPRLEVYLESRILEPPARKLFYIKAKRRWGAKVFFASFIMFIGVVVFLGFNVYEVKNQAANSLWFIYDKLYLSQESFKNFKLGEARVSLTQARDELNAVKKNADKYGFIRLSEMVGAFFPVAQSVPEFFDGMQKLFGSSVNLTDEIEELKKNGFVYFYKDGGKLIALLQDIDRDLKTVSGSSASLLRTAQDIKNSPFSDYLPSFDFDGKVSLLSNLYGAEENLDVLLGLLKKPEGFHFLLFFQNPSEMRPSGGFIGSYADLEIKNGQINNIDVRDIYDPDGQLDLKIIPPRPMQNMTVKWGARDANWFFDFPTSAEKVIWFLEQSKMYSEKGVNFEGALAINTNIIEDLLGLTGPIELPEYKLIINADNFLAEVQKEVETGHNKALNQPKKILKDLAPLLLERLENLDETKKEEFYKIFSERANKKDVQIYFRNKILQDSALKWGLAGEAFSLPQNFPGEYLAVVNANIAGGKTDIFMNQNIALKISVDTEGRISNELTVKRTHNGDKSKYSWYKAANQNFMRLLLPLGTEIDTASGVSEKWIKTIKYDLNEFKTDALVQALEKDNVEGGKTTFGSWVIIKAGETKEAVFSYRNPHKIEIGSGKKFQFVFDRQSGVKTAIDIEVEAPGGYKWAESGNSVFIYRSDNPEKRIALDLTLKEL